MKAARRQVLAAHPVQVIALVRRRRVRLARRQAAAIVAVQVVPLARRHLLRPRPVLLVRHCLRLVARPRRGTVPLARRVLRQAAAQVIALVHRRRVPVRQVQVIAVRAAPHRLCRHLAVPAAVRYHRPAAARGLGPLDFISGITSSTLGSDSNNASSNPSQ